jgi:hypothetical protein
VTLKTPRSLWRAWGTRHRFRFRDDQGHCFIWWTDIYSAGISAGTRALAKMTVKEHSRYRGTDETVVQNVRVHAINREQDTATQGMDR